MPHVLQALNPRLSSIRSSFLERAFSIRSSGSYEAFVDEGRPPSELELDLCDDAPHTEDEERTPMANQAQGYLPPDAMLSERESDSPER